MSEKTSLGRITRRSVEDDVYAGIRDAILTGEIVGGDRLVHEDLASRFGTSRIPVRDALKRLVFDGLIETDARRGYWVTSFGRDDIEEIYGLRQMLESYAVRCACPRLSDADLTELEQLQEEIEHSAEAGDTEHYVALNHTFHSRLYDGAEQPRLERIINSLWHGLPPLTPITGERSLTHTAAQHRDVLQALRQRDADAAGRAMQRHIAEAGAQLCRQLERAGADTG